MDLFINTVRTLSRAAGVLAAALLAVSVAVTCQQVLLRYVFNMSTTWQTEFVTFAIIASTFIGSPYVLLVRGHVNVDLLPIYLGRRARLSLALVASTAALVLCGVLGWKSVELWMLAWTGGWTTPTIWALPLWIAYLPMAAGLILLALQYVIDIICLLNGRDMPFGLDAEGRTMEKPS